jgi:adenylate cyclase
MLFSDISGFTSLSERLEPEEIALILNNYLNKMTQIVFHHRGTVNKFIGDAVMAIFGAPPIDDPVAAPERAIRAAIEMQGSLQEFLNQLADDRRFQIRIGINTGAVVAGYIGAEKHLEYTVLGDAVNIASRLESLCPPGSILVGPKTHELTKERFRFRPHGSNRLKGKKQAVETFEVLF